MMTVARLSICSSWEVDAVMMVEDEVRVGLSRSRVDGGDLGSCYRELSCAWAGLIVDRPGR